MPLFLAQPIDFLQALVFLQFAFDVVEFLPVPIEVSFAPQEVAQLAEQIDRAPAAGADVLGFFLVLFVVLLITDALGMTKVFPFTRSMR